MANNNNNNNQVCDLIGQKLDVLVDDAMVDIVSDEVGQLLRTCNAKRHLFDAAKKILEKGFAVDRSACTIYGKLLSNLIGTTIICAESGKLCSFKDALCSYVTQPVTLTTEAFEAFCHKIPLMNELFRLRLVQWSAIKVLISGLQQDDEISMRYLLELVRNTDRLIDEHIAAFPKCNSDPYWCALVDRLKHTYDNRIVTDPSLLMEMNSFFQTLKHKHRWSTNLTMPNDKKRRSSKSESECIPAKRPSSPLSITESQIGTPIGRVMDILSKDPHYLTIATGKLKTILANSHTSVSFAEGVFELLNATYAADSRTFPACIQLLESMRDLAVGDVTFIQAVARCTAARNKFETLEQVDRFCASFRLTNELYRTGLISKDIFQNYTTELTTGEDELAYVLLYKIMLNVVKLVESGYAKLSPDETKFWSLQDRRLVGSLHRNVIKSPKHVSEISDFLKLHELKGGWDKSALPEKKPGDLELICMLDGIALVGNFKTWLWPLVAKFESISSPSEFSDAFNLFLVKMCELIVDEQTLNEASEICQLLANTEFVRGNNFLSEFQTFCLRVLPQCRENLVLTTTNSSLENLLHLLTKRRQGCIRLIGRLYLAQVLDVNFLVTFCNTLLFTVALPAIECLFWLFTDIGRQFSSAVVEKGLVNWWNKFFEDVTNMLQNPATPDEIKRLAKAILVEKSQWPLLDAKTRAREILSKLLSELTVDLRKSSPGEFATVIQKIRNLLAKEVADHNTQQMFEILLMKIDSSYKEAAAAVDVDRLPANPTPLPTTAHD